MKKLIKKVKGYIYRIIPTKIYLRLLYRKTFKRKLNLKSPDTLNEKIQWKKIYDHNPFYTKLADKYAVRDYIKRK